VSTGVLVIGAGQAGVQVATSLREAGFDGPVTMVGDEPHVPYQRPPLSKSFLADPAGPRVPELRNQAFFDRLGISLLTGERVGRLDLDARAAVTHTGQELRFGQVVLATGSRPRRLAVPGADLAEVHHLRTVDDAVSLGEGLRSARSVVVIGGGFIGLEVAAVARQLGLDVTVLEASSRVAGRSVAPEVSDYLTQAQRRAGVDVRVGAVVEAIERTGGGSVAIHQGAGDAVVADLVLVAVGAVPNIELAVQAGLEVHDGIVVDASGRTSHPAAWAVGDCTVAPHPELPGATVRLESVPAAIEQAKAAAADLLGRGDHVRSVPWFWSDQGSLKLQTVGLSHGYDLVVSHIDAEGAGMTALYFTGDRLVAADCVNSPKAFVQLRRLLGRGGTYPRELAESVGLDLALLGQMST
jgi:3-phenylpropionate/trans-cinnamate dioxygenase ferredoxin reductase subunit